MRVSSRMVLTSLSSVARCALGGAKPARRDLVRFKKFCAVAFNACFVVLVTFFEENNVGNVRKRLEGQNGGCG
jgi:hypothetical protein